MTQKSAKKPLTNTNNLNCTYRIILQPYQTVQLRFKYFNLNPAAISTGQYRVAQSPSSQDISISLKSSASSSNLSRIGGRVLRTKKQQQINATTTTAANNVLRNAVLVENNIPFVSDYDYISIYDGATLNAPLLAHLTSYHNDFNKHLAAKTFNARSNSILVVFHTRAAPANNLSTSGVMHGFNMTYQIKGKRYFTHF